MQKFGILGKVLPFVLAFVVFMAGFIVPDMIRSSWASDESQASSAVESARVAADESKYAAEEKQAASVEDSTGFDKAKFDDDVATIENFLRTASTWDSCDSYNAARDKVKETHGVKDDSQFMTSYMPYIEPNMVNGKGEVMEGQNFIDNRGLNLHFDNLSAYYAGKDDKTGNYMYYVEFSTSSSRNGQSSGRNSLLRCSVDGDTIIDPYATFVS